MFSDSITYEDYDGTKRIDHLYFNISKTDLAADLKLLDRVEEMQKNLQGPKRELTTPEKQEILDLVKRFMEMAYGVKTPDGRGFIKSKEVWENFRWSAAYDAYLFSLFQDARKAFGFILEVLPKDFRAAIPADMKSELDKLISSGDSPEPSDNRSELKSPEELHETDGDKPAWFLEGRVPTPEEFRVATPKQQFLAFQMKASQ